MSSHKERLEGLLMREATKIRKRGCSPASSSSSVVQNNRFKRAILVGKRGGGGSSTTPLPTGRTVRSRSPAVAAVVAAGGQPPKCSGRSRTEQPVSARKLAATLWELNEVHSPTAAVGESLTGKTKGRRRWEKEGRRIEDWKSSLLFPPPHLSDPRHSPVSERLEELRTGHRRRESPISGRPTIHDRSRDSISSTSVMEQIESRSRCQTPAGAKVGSRTCLKDISNALTTSKELLKIISRLWCQHSRSSSTMSLMSAMHIELERARAQVNQLILLEENLDRNEVSYVLKQFEEANATWKSREHEKVEVAIKSIREELDVERRLRRRFESLNKKLEGDLARMKASFINVSEELEREKRAKESKVFGCEELTRNIGEDKAQIEDLKSKNVRISEKVEKEKGMLRISDAALREERAQLKLLEAKQKLIEAFLRRKEEARCSTDHRLDGDLIGRDIDFCGKEEGDNGSTDDLLQLYKDEFHKRSSSISRCLVPRNSKNQSTDEELKGQRTSTSKASRRTSDLARWDSIVDTVQAFDNKGISGTEKLPQRRSCGDDVSRYRSVKCLRDQKASTSRTVNERGYVSPSMCGQPSRSTSDKARGRTR
ncbi:hypothetical protein Dimus_034774 [Dionaea muscipula]